MTIRVLVVDDQQAVRSALCLVLGSEPDIDVVGDVGDGAAAIVAAQETGPDVVLMDIRMPRMDGIAAIRELRGTAVIALTTFDLDEYLFGALAAGAVGFLLKDSPPQRVLDAVRAAADGHGLIDPTVTPRLVARFAALSPRPAGQELRRLTAREHEVLLLVAEGLSNAEIARDLWIEEGTVKTHVNRLLAKLGLRTRVHVVGYAYEHGLLAGGSARRHR
ncbi:response regulator transcription factor [Pseudonocardia sp. MH-G8]|uniref:response regulator n=1 Tax=Pseudonocardia sp. MH-G8 TaxID=1854588 RepID=UPI000BA0117C|nr:response regulator transcription factor [Pseudonocardia sp. MH-G8]OZM78310.1 DNA-binding response regulator [Pseudonocardia sp. MH-G8]